MLSRIAESMFWIGRYVERASDQARVLEVNLDLGAEAAGGDPNRFGIELCRAMGAVLPDEPTFDEIWAVLGLDGTSPVSMVSALTNCRESARRAREVLSSDTWEAINRSYRRVSSGRLVNLRPTLACREVLDFCGMIVGTLHETMTRDQAWQFLRAGRYMERVDMTARILYASAASPQRPSSHHVLLRACSAQQAFVVTRGRDDTMEAAVDFLLRDRLFPRSIVHCLSEARSALSALEPGNLRTGFEDDAQRLLGRASANVEYASPAGDLPRLASITEALQMVTSRSTQALTSHYFEGAVALEWHER